MVILVRIRALLGRFLGLYIQGNLNYKTIG